MSEFKTGDVVQLKSGGPKMTITKVIDGDSDIEAFVDKKSFISRLVSRIFDYTLVPASFQVYDIRPLAGT